MTATKRVVQGLDLGRELYDLREVAESAGWTTKRTRRLLLQKNGAQKVGGRWYTTKAMMREALGARLAAPIIAGLPER